MGMESRGKASSGECSPLAASSVLRGQLCGTV